MIILVISGNWGVQDAWEQGMFDSMYGDIHLIGRDWSSQDILQHKA